MHVGTACISNNDPELECFSAPEIASEITGKLHTIANEHSNAKVHYSSIIYRTDVRDVDDSYKPVSDIIDETNKIVREHCASHDMAYIDNANIEVNELHDGVQLNVPGAQKFAKNIASSLKGVKARARKSTTDPKKDSPFHRLRLPTIGERPDMRRSRYNNPGNNVTGSYSNAVRSQYHRGQYPTSYQSQPHNRLSPPYSQRSSSYQPPGRLQHTRNPGGTGLENMNSNRQQADLISAVVNNVLNAFNSHT